MRTPPGEFSWTDNCERKVYQEDFCALDALPAISIVIQPGNYDMK